MKFLCTNVYKSKPVKKEAIPRSNTPRIGAVVPSVLAAVCIALFVTACPATAGSGSGGSDSSANNSGTSESFVPTEVQQLVYDGFIQNLEKIVKKQTVSSTLLITALREINENIKPLGFIIVDTKQDTDIAQGTLQDKLKERFICRKDTSTLSPYKPIVSDPAGGFLMITQFDTGTKTGKFVFVRKEAGTPLTDCGNMAINAEKIEVTISEMIFDEQLNDTYSITGKKITIKGLSFDISVLLN